MSQFPYQIRATGNGKNDIISFSTRTHSLERALQMAKQYMQEGWIQEVQVSDQRTGEVCWQDACEN